MTKQKVPHLHATVYQRMRRSWRRFCADVERQRRLDRQTAARLVSMRQYICTGGLQGN